MAAIVDLARNHPLTVSEGVTLTRSGAVFVPGASIGTPATADLGGGGDLCLEWGGVIDTPVGAVAHLLSGIREDYNGVATIYLIVVLRDGHVRASFSGTPGAASFEFTGNVCDGQFHRFCLERDGSVARFIVDGVVVGSQPAPTSSLSIIGQRGGQLAFGPSRYTPGLTYAFGGQLGHVRITLAARYRGSYAVGPLAYGQADPFWSSTSLAVLLSEPPIGLHDDLLRRLLPPHSMDRLGPNLTAELRAYSAALDTAAEAAAGLLAEADPRSTLGLLADWERNYGLEAGSASEVSRRSALIGQILAGGGQSRGYYVALAAALGYTATIEEFALHTVMSPVTFPLYGRAWRFVWKVRARASAGAVSHAAFESLINKLKPAHTRVVFEYY